jgi:hypothetical protein
MIKLIDGKGQLGNVLQGILEKENIKTEEDVFIYHTWNFLDKSENTQKECYDKLVDFVDKNKDIKIVFISTYSQTENFYNFYKQLSEAYLLTNHKKGYVVRLPTLIGKGICLEFRNEEKQAFGEMELMTINDAAREILKIAQTDSLVRNFRVKGTIVSAKFVKDLILFGRDGK